MLLIIKNSGQKLFNESDEYFIRHITLLIACIFLGFCSCSQKTDQNTSKNEFSNLDGLNTVPEWLSLEVERSLPNSGLNVWIPTDEFQTSSLLRIPRFPNDSVAIDPINNGRVLEIEAIRNEQVSAQIAVASTEDISNLTVKKNSDFTSNDDTIIKADNINVRFVKFLPVEKSHIGAKYKEVNTEGVSGDRNPDVVGDPLIEAEKIDVPKLRTQPIWFTFRIPKNAAPGTYNGFLEVQTDQYDTIRLNVSLHVLDFSIPDPDNFVFDLDIWLNPYAVADFHNIEPWSDEHWELLKPYVKDLSSRGQENITTIIVEQPWKIPWLNGKFRSQTESPYHSMIKWIHHPDGSWSFDYSIFDEYVQFALDQGSGPRITAYSMLAFRGEERITYMDIEKNKLVEENIDVMSDRYERIWSLFLNNLQSHLKEKGWLDHFYLAFDERPEKLMNRVHSIITKSAPEFEEKIYLSGGEDDEKNAQWNVSYEILFEPGILEAITRRSKKGLPVRFGQTCCSGPHPNRFTFNPAVELQMIAWLVMDYNFTGYVDWAYNSWPKDIFNNPVFIYPQGDEYFVYPGHDGLISSIRWELLLEGIEDFELAQVLRKKGQLNERNYQNAISLATRNKNGEKKSPIDLIKARKILLNKN